MATLSHNSSAYCFEEYDVDAEPFEDSNYDVKPVCVGAVADNDSKNVKCDISNDSEDKFTTSENEDEYKIEINESSEMGGFKVEGSAVEVSHSTGVHIGNKEVNKTFIKFGNPKSVIVDRRQITIVNTHHERGVVSPSFLGSEREKSVNSSKPSDSPAIVEKVRKFNRNRYSNQQAHLTPLPWWTWFSPHLENMFTGFQMVIDDPFDGCNDQSIIHLEQIFDSKKNSFTSMKSCPTCRILIEGNPGYGKTTLTLKMASDWAAEKNYISMFHLVFRIPLREFQGDLQSYIFRELFPQYEEQGCREDWWHYLKNNHENVLFLLDGLDELSPEHREPIDMLLKGNVFDKVSIIATSRTVRSDDPVLCFFNRRIQLRGFSPSQTEQFIKKYFEYKQKPKGAAKLISLLNGPRWCGRDLTTCPLTCLFLCVVFEDGQDENTLHKTTQIYYGLISWLVRRAPYRKNRSETNSIFSENISIRHYERILANFGMLCLEVLSRGETQFTNLQLQQLPDNTGAVMLDLGLLIRSMEIGTSLIRMPSSIFYQPIHKTFLEYFSALYISQDLEERFPLLLSYFDSPHASSESVNLILKFLAGLLRENAANLFRLFGLSALELSSSTLFEMLIESGSSSENLQALSSILNDEIVTVYSSPVELDGWASLLAAPDCPIRSLKFIWNHAPFNNASLDRFFAAFQSNHSVTCLAVTAANGFFPNDNDALIIGAFTVQALKKISLRHFSIHLVGDTWSNKVITAINQMIDNHQASPSLVTLKINVDLGTEQVEALCKGLKNTNIKSLVLPKLSCAPEGYATLSHLTKTLDHLSVSLNLMKTLPNLPEERLHEVGSPEDLRSFTAFFNASARQQAGILEKELHEDHSAINDSKLEIDSAVSFVNFMEPNLSSSSRLADGARSPGIIALGISELLSVNKPTCNTNQHSSGFHSVFTALREPDCRLTKLDLTGCCLGPLDFACLGEALPNNSSIQYLRIADIKIFKDVLRLLTKSSVSWLDLSSTFISIEDEDIFRLLRALASADKLTSLSLAGWKFSVKQLKLLSLVDRFMETCPIKELNLTKCKFHLDRAFLLPSLGSASSCSALNENFSDSSPQLEKTYRAAFRRNWKRPPYHASRSLDDASGSSSTSMDWSASKDYSQKKKLWPHLVKLSLNETSVMLQSLGGREAKTLIGPELFLHIDKFLNLVELSLNLTTRMSESERQFNDASTKEFFTCIQTRLGHSLEKLSVSFLNIKWNRPAQTAGTVAKRLQKCKKLVSLQFNYLQFSAKLQTDLPTPINQQPHQHHIVENEDSKHWFLGAIISGCPKIEELSLVGSPLNISQTTNLAIAIRDNWKGNNLDLHILQVGKEEQETEDIVSALQLVFKFDEKFHLEYVGGYRGTLFIRRRKHLCSGLVSQMRQLKLGVRNTAPRLSRAHQDSFFPKFSFDQENQRESQHSINYIEGICYSLPPGQRSLFGLNPFDYSIMQAHSWSSNKW